MVFSSPIFLLAFLPITLLLYFVAPARHRNAVLVANSSLFYLWGAGWQILILLSVAIVDYNLGWRVYRSTKYKKAWLTLSIVFNLSLLGYVKYANFLVSIWNSLVGSLHLPLTVEHWRSVGLPLGISFFTFETMSYVIDIYRGRQRPAQRVIDYALYISMFPHLVAGPIYRYGELEPEIDATKRASNQTTEAIFDGVWQFTLGVGKKVFIANTMGRVADTCFNQSNSTTLECWVGVVAYAFQIFYDFSGYSDMSIGLGKIFGFHFPKNFDLPYASSSITEFWRRWHMTLSRWFRDYLYIPLGGNQHGTLVTLRNLIVVFLLCGLWHGASWTFVGWGAYHGALLIAERIGLGTLLARSPRVVARLWTFVAVLVGWVFFRAESFSAAISYLHRMFVPMRGWPSAEFLELTLSSRAFFFVSAVACLSLVDLRQDLRPMISGVGKSFLFTAQVGVVLVVLCWSVGTLAVETFNPFIYFRF